MSLLEHEIEIIIEIHQYISHNFKPRIMLADYAARYNISETTLASGYKFLYKKSIYRYRLEKLMEYAKSLLEQGHKIKAVSKELGYRSPESFSRAFKKVFMMPPAKVIKKEASHEVHPKP